MKTKRLVALASTAMVLLALSACGSGSSGTDTGDDAYVADHPSFPEGTTMAKLADAGKITIGTKFDQPLFGLKGLNGKPEGFDVEVAKYIAGGLGIGDDGIHWVETPSSVRDEYIAQGKVDFITATYAITDERRQHITFGGPYYEAGSEIMVLSDNEEITGPESFSDAGLKVCTVTGAIDAEALKPYLADEKSQLVQFDVFSKCADALRTGQVDAVAADSVTLLGLQSTSKDKFKIVGKPYYKQPFGVGIKKGDIEFCKYVNDRLQKMYDDGTYAKAWAKTAGTASPETPKLPKLGPCE